MRLSRLSAAVLAVGLVFGAQPAVATHAGLIDQQQTTFEVRYSCGIGTVPGNVAQVVTPSATAWAQVELLLAVSASGPGSSLTLNVRNDAIDGPIIGSASVVLPDPPGGGLHWIPFHFEPAVPLTPGIAVFLEVHLESQIATWAGSGLDPYAGGSSWSNCLAEFLVEVPSRDFAFVTYAPAGGDADGDGLPDAVDPDTIGAAIEGLPSDAMSHGHRTAMQARLEGIEAIITTGDAAAAVAALHDLRRRVDGCGVAADLNDWITHCPSQLTVRAMIDAMIVALDG